MKAEDFRGDGANLHPVEHALGAVCVIERVCPDDTTRLGDHQVSFPAISLKLIVPPVPFIASAFMMDDAELQSFADQRYTESFFIADKQLDGIGVSIDSVIHNKIVLGETQATRVVYFAVPKADILARPVAKNGTPINNCQVLVPKRPS